MLNDRDSLLRKLHGLRSEHRDLDTVIARLADQGASDQLHLQRLKKRKLMLRDEIAWLESRLIPDSIACYAGTTGAAGRDHHGQPVRLADPYSHGGDADSA